MGIGLYVVVHCTLVLYLRHVSDELAIVLYVVNIGLLLNLSQDCCRFWLFQIKLGPCDNCHHLQEKIIIWMVYFLVSPPNFVRKINQAYVFLFKCNI